MDGEADPGAQRFRQLFAANYGDLLGYAVRRCPSRADAEDVVAETFTVAWRRLGAVPDGDQSRLWLFATARWVCRNQQRAQRRQAGLLSRLRQLPRDRHAPPADASSDDREQVVQALASLGDSDREVLLLHAYEELPARDIGEVLGISEAAVWKRLQRARTRLSRALTDPPDTPVARFGTARPAGEDTP